MVLFTSYLRSKKRKGPPYGGLFLILPKPCSNGHPPSLIPATFLRRTRYALKTRVSAVLAQSLHPPQEARPREPVNSRLNKMYIAFTASIMSDFCGNNGRYGDNGIPFSTLSPHSTKFHASFRASIFCVFSEMRTNVIRKVAHMLYFFITCQKGRKPVWFPPRV